MEYLSDGITEAIINTLSQLPRLRVMARSTVFRYKGRPQEPQDIGRDLNVRAVLTGRVLHRGDMIVIGRSQQLDPLSLIVATGLGRILHFAGRFDEAIAQYRQVIRTDPTFSRVWFDLGLTLAATGAYDQARLKVRVGDQAGATRDDPPATGGLLSHRLVPCLPMPTATSSHATVNDAKPTSTATSDSAAPTAITR